MTRCRSRGHWVSTLEPDLGCFLRGYLYQQSTHEMLSFYTLRKVQGLRKLVFTVIFLILLSCPTHAFPRGAGKPKVEVMEHSDKIILRTSGCKPLSPDQLRARMGAYFDESKMRSDDYDDDVLSDDNRKRGSQYSVIDDDDIEDEDAVLDSFSNYDIRQQDTDTTSVHDKKFMRRKRDAGNSSESDSSYLYQNLLYETISKRKSRQKRSSSHTKFAPAWNCEKEKVWKKMKKGYFPSQILDGRCTQKSCFFHQYKCNPVKYALKVLRRDPKEACNPVPLIGNSTTYEESWVFKRIYVTVACECGIPKSNSRRNRGRTRG